MLSGAPNVLTGQSLSLVGTENLSIFFVIAIHKSLGIPQISVKECFKLVLHDWDRVVCFLLPLMLLPVEVHLVPKEGRGKINLVSTFSLSGGKVILTLLIEIVAFHMQLTVVHIWEASFQKLVLGFLKSGRSLSFQKSFENLL